jgi:hypothetical protein
MWLLLPEELKQIPAIAMTANLPCRSAEFGFRLELHCKFRGRGGQGAAIGCATIYRAHP